MEILGTVCKIPVQHDALKLIGALDLIGYWERLHVLHSPSGAMLSTLRRWMVMQYKRIWQKVGYSSNSAVECIVDRSDKQALSS